MQALRLYIEGAFNSFPFPKEMKYQRTSFYPPKTTLIGLLGAAIGLEDRKLEELYDAVLVGIVMKSFEGTAKDLWRIIKPKSGKDVESAVITREILYNPIYWSYFAPQSKYNCDELKNAFSNPVYPLTLGRSDELILIRYDAIETINLKEAETDACYKHTVLPFDYKKEEYEFEEVLSDTSFKIPQTFKIPTKFEYKKRARKEKEPHTFTHVYNLGLKFAKRRGWSDGERNFFMF